LIKIISWLSCLEAAAQDDMQKLEQQATEIASESSNDTSAPSKSVLFVRGESQNTKMDEMGETKNPEEIELADSDSDESDSGSEEDGRFLSQPNFFRGLFFFVWIYFRGLNRFRYFAKVFESDR